MSSSSEMDGTDCPKYCDIASLDHVFGALKAGKIRHYAITEEVYPFPYADQASIEREKVCQGSPGASKLQDNSTTSRVFFWDSHRWIVPVLLPKRRPVHAAQMVCLDPTKGSTAAEMKRVVWGFLGRTSGRRNGEVRRGLAFRAEWSRRCGLP